MEKLSGFVRCGFVTDHDTQLANLCGILCREPDITHEDDREMLKYLTDKDRWRSGPGEPMDAEQLAYKRGIHDGLNAKGHIEDIAANESEEDTDPNEFSPANLTPDERAIYDQGYDNGHDDGYDDGYNDGYADGLVAVSEAIDDLQSQEVFDVFATKEDFERAAEFQEEVDKESGI